jgi:2,4-dienoyl-CoA reductase-like NADH-dependent reductase (Old Yellow Enzyme family)
LKTQLFSPLSIKDLTLMNRIVVSPMCQYSADEGNASEWLLMHLGQFALSGVALVVTEATAVEAEGRITRGCLGLYSSENEAALARVIAFCRRYGKAALGIQIAHAGRKASSHLPWKGGTPLGPEEGAWPTLGPSAIPYRDGQPIPRAATEDDLSRVAAAFVRTAERANRLGFDWLELHAAHGYLLHSFLSPLSNLRTDQYGGTLQNRMRFPLEVFQGVRDVWPSGRPLGVRLSASDWVSGGWTIEDSIIFALALKGAGCDYVDVSSGGLSPYQKITVGPGYQVPFAEAIRKKTGLTTIAVGMITDPLQAESILKNGQADLLAIARGMLYDPRWVWHAAKALGEKAYYPPQYERAEPR